jgi:hypothetical protein
MNLMRIPGYKHFVLFLEEYLWEVKNLLWDFESSVTPPPFNLTVLLNPIGGAGKAKSIWNDLKEMFEIAAIKVTLVGI